MVTDEIVKKQCFIGRLEWWQNTRKRTKHSKKHTLEKLKFFKEVNHNIDIKIILCDGKEKKESEEEAQSLI